MSAELKAFKAKIKVRLEENLALQARGVLGLEQQIGEDQHELELLAREEQNRTETRRDALADARILRDFPAEDARIRKGRR